MAKVKSIVYKCGRCGYQFEDIVKDGVYRIGLCCANDMAQMNVEGFTYEIPIIEEPKKKVKK